MKQLIGEYGSQDIIETKNLFRKSYSHVLYYIRKREDPTFRAGTWGGLRNTRKLDPDDPGLFNWFINYLNGHPILQNYIRV